MNKETPKTKFQSRLRPSVLPPPPVVRDEDEDLQRAVGISIGLHLAVAAVLTLRAVIYPSEPLIMERAVRVDMVGLPDKIKEPPKKAAEPTPPKPEPPAPEQAKAPPPPPKMPEKPKVAIPETSKVNLNNTKRAQDNAIARLKQKDALAKIAKDVKEDAVKNVKAEAPQPIKGNEVSPGTALSGLAKIENDAYFDSLDEHVKKHWHLPNFLANARLNASVIIYVDERGNIINKKMVRPSGNSIFDESVMDALDRASPFPAPPKRLVNIFMVDGIQLGFPE